jgi:hypothetical protein
MRIWLTIAAVLAALAIGLPLSIWLTAPIRKNNKAFAIASALFFSFGLYNPTVAKIEEGREDTDHAKRQKAGDPPDPEEDA